LLGRWIGAYRSGTYHLADKPWGPFSPAGDWLLTTPDDLQANIMHVSWLTAYKDGFFYVSDGNPPQNEDGKVYSMHVIPRFCRGTQDAYEMYYTLSTWNPYDVVIMRSEIGLPQPNEPAVSENLTIMPGDASWNMTSSTFFQNVTKFGKPAISTSNDAQGVASTGLMWRWLPRDYWNQELSFTVSGGCEDAYGAEVILLEGGGDLPTSGNVATIYSNIKSGTYGKVVRDNWGVCGALVGTDTAVDCTWSLKPFDRSNLKVAIIDDLNRSWGYIDVSQMTLDRNVPTVGTAVSTVTPGDAAWTLSPGAWNATVNIGGVNYFRTSTGDPTMKGVAWRWLPRDWKNKQLDFQLLGGDARVLLIQGVEPIPVDGDMDALWTALQAGDYGSIRFSAQGPNNNTTPTPVSWDLTTVDSDKMKIVILDDVTDSWGYISVSPMTLTRYDTGNRPPTFTSNPIIKADATVGVGYTGNIHVNATDPDAGDTLTYSKLDGPKWLSMGSAGNFGSAQSIPSASDVGLNQWHVRVKDAENAYADALLQINVAGTSGVESWEKLGE
ncbi:MAG: hypothetical protein NTW86_00065, partial [Candidatus Sumerlaeota bacterium]|nr:hypothetical protein [Candidatus Sumerlaeota bacterium]